ncbi:hypothetical protein D3C73_1533420 [compost metagenome]
MQHLQELLKVDLHFAGIPAQFDFFHLQPHLFKVEIERRIMLKLRIPVIRQPDRSQINQPGRQSAAQALFNRFDLLGRF